MKKLVFLFLIVISYFVNSQDYEPTQAKFNWGYGGNETYLSADSSYFKQDKFLRGWHWGGSFKISKALSMNQKDATNRNVAACELDSNCLIILKPVEYTHSVEKHTLNARAIHYEPTLTLNPNNPSNLVIRQGDTTRPVFGFLNRRGRVLTDSTDPNFNRLIIDGDSLINQVILSEPWPCNQLSMFGKSHNPDTANYTFDNYLCRTLIFSINLRRAGIEINNDTVLKIELPYTYLYDSSYIIPPDSLTIHHKTLVGYENIQFANLPSPAQYPNGTYELTNGRGSIRDTIPLNNSGVRAIYITKQMLPPNNKDITISAFFKCNGDWRRHNYELKDENAKIGEIDSIKIKITYLCGGPLMIDWVRIETPHAQRFLRGDYDSSMILNVQWDLNKIVADSFSTKGIKFFRYNPVIEGRLQNWIAEKYYNKLIGNISTNEANKVIYPAHYEYYVNSPNRWLGIYQFNNLTAAPYCCQTNMLHGRIKNSVLTMGIAYGREGRFTKDSLNSEYELWLYDANGDSVTISDMLTKSESEYAYLINRSSSSVQKKHESKIYEYYAGQNSGFIFLDKFWWAQNFILNDWHWSKDSASHTTYSKIPLDSRPLTGEELRLSCWNALIMGAKGLFYDGPDFNYHEDIQNKPETYSNTRLQHYNYTKENIPVNFDYMTDKEFLDSDNPYIGGDFISSIYEPNSLYDKLQNKDSIAFNMGTTQDKLYIGRRTQRLELKKIHDQIRRCEDELMKLRLVAWMGKGYRLWNNHHPDYPANVLSQYLAWDTTNNRIDTMWFVSNKI